MKLQHLRLAGLLAALSAAGLLSACNGGSGSGSDALNVSATPTLNAVAGQQIVLNGYATTAGQSVTSAAWQQISGPAVQMTNASCATSSTHQVSSAGTASAPSGAVLGNYVCPLTVQLPQSASGENYTFRFTATDSLGNTQSAQSSVTTKASANASLTAVAGPNANLYPDQAYTGYCQTTGGSYNSGQMPTYQWSITGPSGVTPPALSASGPSVQLTAPTLASNANFTLACQVADGIGGTATGTANLTVYGTGSLPPIIANAGNAQIVGTAVPVNLTATAQVNGGSPSVPVYYYWAQTGGKNTVTLANANTANASFVAPGTPSSTAASSGASAPAPSVYDTLTFTVYTSYQPISASDLSSIPTAQQAQTVVTVVQQ